MPTVMIMRFCHLRSRSMRARCWLCLADDFSNELRGVRRGATIAPLTIPGAIDACAKDMKPNLLAGIMPTRTGRLVSAR
jgi:hypothetical protein